MSDKSLHCGDVDCEGADCTCRKKPEPEFHVSAGKYDDQERNCKYCESFHSLADALAAWEKYKSYPWAVIEYRKYELTPYRVDGL